MAKDPAFLFYSGDFMTGTYFFSDEQVGKYIRLICMQHQKGHLSEEDMMKICKTYDKDIWLKFLKDDEGLFYNEKLENEIIDSLCEHFNIDMNLPIEEKYALLRKNGVPEETMYENGACDYPESAKYWKFDEYEYYIEHNIEYIHYISQIDEINLLVAGSHDDLIKKSLILSAFIFTESFITSKIVNKIGDLKKQNNELVKSLLENYAENDLWRSANREKIFKIIFGQTLKNIPMFEIRHSLAHDIGSANIVDNKITCIGKDNVSKTHENVLLLLKKAEEEIGKIRRMA